jgi:tRNA-specific 2-thiouridylase
MIQILRIAKLLLRFGISWILRYDYTVGCEAKMKNPGHDHGAGPTGGSPVDVKAIAAFSGGLDSILAAMFVHRLGVDVTLLHVQHLFSANEEGRERIRAAAERVGLPLRIVDASAEHLEVIRNPKHGYGRGMNPCIDCRIFMLKIAKRVMEEEGAQFVVSGEVLGQRPNSQHHRALLQAAEESGLGDRLLRPLSANLLPDTHPVKEGWLRKVDLLAIQGRSRETQMALAEELGVSGYPQPAGGCVLVEKAYAARVRDAFAHVGREHVDVQAFRLLRIGRHFRLSDRVKAIVGRNERENDALVGFATGRSRIEPVDVMGPTTLIEGDPSEDELLLVAALAARYSDHGGRRTISMTVSDLDTKRIIDVVPLANDDLRIAEWRIE